MMLLIDVGNSRTKYVQLINGHFSATTQLANNDFNVSYFDKYFCQCSKIIVANVAKPALTDELASWCAKHNVSLTQAHSEQKKNTLISAYQVPTTLGIDRWLALLGALSLYPNENILIIDAGTATTVDLLSRNGQHQGGWILAGIKALFNSILTNSTLVHAQCKTQASLAFGTNTTDNVNNACWAATVGMIEQAVVQAKQIVNVDRIILTGGDGKALTQLLLAQTSSQSSTVDNIQFMENLIFYGLAQYA